MYSQVSCFYFWHLYFSSFSCAIPISLIRLHHELHDLEGALEAAHAVFRLPHRLYPDGSSKDAASKAMFNFPLSPSNAGGRGSPSGSDMSDGMPPPESLSGGQRMKRGSEDAEFQAPSIVTNVVQSQWVIFFILTAPPLPTSLTCLKCRSDVLTLTRVVL